MTRNSFTFALLIASMLSTPAVAAEPAGAPIAWPQTVTVEARIDLADLDLATPAGLAEARRRAVRSIGELCRPEAAPAGTGRGRIDGRCFRDAMASARLQIDRAVAARTGQIQTASIAAERPAAER